MNQPPQPQNPQQRRNLILGAFETLVEAERQGQLSPEFVKDVIHEAEVYALRNRLYFDGTFKHAIKLAEQADRLVQDFHAIQEKEGRTHAEERRKKIGYSGATRVKDLLN